MYRTILVPLDGTWFGEHALPIARGIARRFGAALHLVHVHTEHNLPVAVESLPYVGVPAPGPSVEQERAYLEEVASAMSDASLRVTTELVQGPLTESLERYALDRGADLVVACTHCHEGLSRFWHQGVGEQILRDTSLPILMIRSDDTEPDLSSERTFRHILIPLNGSPYAEEILDKAIPLGRGSGARFTLLRVIRPMMVVGYTLLAQDAHVNHFLLEEQQQEAEAYLNRIAERLRAAELVVYTDVVANEDPAAAIVDATRPRHDVPPVDLIAMSTHSRGPFSRVVLSSITDEVLHDAPVPLLLHHPIAQTAEAAEMSAAHGAQAGEMA
jgi:nucleotide-binding universal stress UspA family protein